MYPSNVTVAVDDEQLRQEALRALLPLTGQVSWSEKHPENWTALVEHLEVEDGGVLLLDVGSRNGDLAPTLRQVRSRAPQTRIVALHREADPQTILNAMRAGVAEFVHSPLDEHLLPALARIEEHSATPDNEVKLGKLIAFLSAKGGCGATTLASHVAAELARQTKSEVMLADFDFTSGAISFLMKNQSPYSVLDAVKNLPRLDENLWRALIGKSPSGLAILPAPSSIGPGDYPHEDDFRRVLRFMRTQHDWTVIDLGRSLTRTARAVLEEVDDLYLVATLDVMALHGLKSIVRAVPEHHLPKLHLILNRAPKMMDITVEELHKILGRPLFATLPNDYPALYHSYTAGTLLPANNRLAEHFAKLTRKVSGAEEPKNAKKRFRLLG